MISSLYFQKTPKKKKKRKSLSDDSAEQEKNDIVAIGTSSGNILLYSIVKADIQSQLVGTNA